MWEGQGQDFWWTFGSSQIEVASSDMVDFSSLFSRHLNNTGLSLISKPRSRCMSNCSWNNKTSMCTKYLLDVEGILVLILQIVQGNSPTQIIFFEHAIILQQKTVYHSLRRNSQTYTVTKAAGIFRRNWTLKGKRGEFSGECL